MEYRFFNDFTRMVKTNILRYLPDSYKNARVEIRKVRKPNVELTGLIIIREKDRGGIVPTLYLESFYQKLFSKDNDLNLDDILTEIAEVYVETAKTAIQVPSAKDIAKKVIFQLINTEDNRDLLDAIPHREFLDLSLIYRSIFNSEKNDDEPFLSSVITNAVMEEAGLKEEELYRMARKNTVEYMPLYAEDMKSVISQIAANSDFEMPDELHFQTPMWVITNKQKLYGASALVYMETLECMAEQLGGSFYILPSSVHEVICIPEELGDIEYLANMVREVNESMVAPEEQLSNNIYHYDSLEKSLSIVPV